MIKHNITSTTRHTAELNSTNYKGKQYSLGILLTPQTQHVIYSMICHQLRVSSVHYGMHYKKESQLLKASIHICSVVPTMADGKLLVAKHYNVLVIL